MLELIGRYQIHEQIGEGAMADVYRAHDPHIDRKLAIKVLKSEFREDREYASRFLREARAAGALSHPGIVTVFDVGEVDGYPFIVMELLDGEPLSEVLKRGPLPPSSVLSIAIQLADALAYAHGQGVIHRDVKPSNIMLSPDGRSLKLLDFGIAQLAEADPLFDEKSYRTQIGQVLGTPRYMSPEQAMGHEMDGRSDIYSVGVVLYEMLSGKRAFPSGNAATLAAQIIGSEPKPLREVAPDTPRGLHFIVHKAMAKQPSQRFADAARLAEALRRESSVADAIAREAATQRSYIPLQVRLTVVLALVTALVLAAAVGTVLIRQRGAMKQVALSSGSAISAFVANNAALRAVDNATLPIGQQDWVPVQAFVKNASADANIRDITVVDASGTIRAASRPTLIGRAYGISGGEPRVDDRGGVAITAAEGGRSFRFVRPILYAGRNFGKVDVLLDQSALRSASRLASLLLILLAVVTTGAVALGTFISARLLQAPISRLRAALFDLARGNLDFRISHHRRDEFGRLFDDVNLVAETMQERLTAVEAMLLDRPAAAPSASDAAAERGDDHYDRHVETPPPFSVLPIEQSGIGVNPPLSDTVNAKPSPPPLAADSTPQGRVPVPSNAGVVDTMAAHTDSRDLSQSHLGSLPNTDTATTADTSPTKPGDHADAYGDERSPDEGPFLRRSGHLAPPWPHDEDDDRTLVDAAEA